VEYNTARKKDRRSPQTRTVQAARTQEDALKASSTVPGHTVVSLLVTNRALKVTLSRATHAVHLHRGARL
jgi:hypothetical protein